MHIGPVRCAGLAREGAVVVRDQAGSGGPVIEVTGLVKHFGELVAVDRLSFEVGEGEVFGFVGPNGAGKTTTVECVAGLRVPDAGIVRVCGLDPVADRDRIRHLVGMQLQSATLPDRLKVWEAVRLYASFYPRPVDEEALLKDVGLDDRRSRRFGKLSGGEKQRLSLALALIGNPRIAILDELTTGLDPQARRDTWALIERIRDRGATIVLVTHYMEEAERLCDRVAVIASGSLIALDSPAGLVKRAGDTERIAFRPSADVEEALLTVLPGVTGVARDGRRMVVTGTGDVASQVIAALTARHVQAMELRVDRPTLDDAFLVLTGHPSDET
ncbi:ABC transporter ATP-binding protein [Nonomuraea sp. PA05]|uniref:ABC transporter ATP-binding protein n=1 Tax=Nonomuraea sp. PA05 TaxID=2604466 RepID=UPI0011DB88DF|nr:ABC transporter ATP-binding protein [Nonomuraea sp. PA05]TYB60180.1 ABC transporter ATP-binding protein [Nonomuraea sp. PA05]